MTSFNKNLLIKIFLKVWSVFNYLLIQKLSRKANVVLGFSQYKKLLKTLKVAHKLPSTIYLCLINRKEAKTGCNRFGSFCVLLMLCKVNFHVVRSAFQNSMSVYFVYFSFLIRSSQAPTFCGIFAGDHLQLVSIQKEAPGVEGVEINLPFGDSEIGG